MRQEGSFRRAPFPVEFVPPALVLVAAGYAVVDEEPVVTLTFDRAINTDGVYDTSGFVVLDAVRHVRLIGQGTYYSDTPESVSLVLMDDGADAGTATTLSVAADNGIVAQDDGVAWAGCDGVPLPYSS